MGLFDNAEPSLTQAYQKSGDVALMNEAVFFVGQMQLTRSQYVANLEDEQQKQRQADLLKASLEAFRAVRSISRKCLRILSRFGGRGASGCAGVSNRDGCRMVMDSPPPQV